MANSRSGEPRERRQGVEALEQVRWVEVICGEWHDPSTRILFVLGRSEEVIYGQTGRDHSYEEIRTLVLEILSGRSGPFVAPQYENLISRTSGSPPFYARTPDFQPSEDPR